MIIAAIIIGFVFLFGLAAGFVAGMKLHDWASKKADENWKKAADLWKAEAEHKQKQHEELRQWAEATIQNVADAAAEHGLTLNLNDMPVTPRPEALEKTEWPDLIGEK